MRRLVLASGSQQRLALLQQVGLNPEVIPAQVDESLPDVTDAVEYVETLARRKAGFVAFELEDAVVLGADTMILLDDGVVGKPAHAQEALAILLALNGRQHEVLTGIAVMDCVTGMLQVGHERTVVRFRNHPKETLQSYVGSGDGMGKAGAYAIQGRGAALVERIDGCYSNIVGLPLALVLEMLAKVGVSPFEEIQT